jgi:hypothetical protein
VAARSTWLLDYTARPTPDVISQAKVPMKASETQSHPNRGTDKLNAASASRRRGQVEILVAYAATSFVWIFFVNYVFELRAFQQLSSLPQLFDHGPSSDEGLTMVSGQYEKIINVPIYHERYASLSPLGLAIGAVFVVAISIGVGWLVAEEEKQHNRWRAGTAICLYVGPSWFLQFLYPDMGGTILVSVIYLSLLFVIRGFQHFEPHFALASTSGRIESFKYRMLFQIYQRYQIVLLGVLGFVAATFMVGASSLLENMYSRPNASGAKIYSAVHMPYLESVYSYAGFGCVALGFGVIRELHEKIQELLRLTPIDSTIQK